MKTRNKRYKLKIKAAHTPYAPPPPKSDSDTMSDNDEILSTNSDTQFSMPNATIQADGSMTLVSNSQASLPYSPIPTSQAFQSQALVATNIITQTPTMVTSTSTTQPTDQTTVSQDSLPLALVSVSQTTQTSTLASISHTPKPLTPNPISRAPKPQNLVSANQSSPHLSMASVSQTTQSTALASTDQSQTTQSPALAPTCQVPHSYALTSTSLTMMSSTLIHHATTNPSFPDIPANFHYQTGQTPNHHLPPFNHSAIHRPPLPPTQSTLGAPRQPNHQNALGPPSQPFHRPMPGPHTFPGPGPFQYPHQTPHSLYHLPPHQTRQQPSHQNYQENVYLPCNTRLTDVTTNGSFTTQFIDALRNDYVIEAFGKALAPLINLAVAEAMESNIQDLRTEYRNLKEENKNLKQTIEKIEVINNKLCEKMEKLDSNVNDIDRFQKMNNLVIRGLPEIDYAERAADNGQEEGRANSTNPSTKRNVINYIKENLNINLREEDIESAYRIRSTGRETTRPIIMRLTSVSIRNNILAARKTLTYNRGGNRPNVFFSEHLTKQNADIFAKTRKLKAERRLATTWTKNGLVYIKIQADSVPKIIHSIHELPR